MKRCIAERTKELSSIRRVKYLTAVYDWLIDSAMVLVALCTFLSYGVFFPNDELTPAQVKIRHTHPHPRAPLPPLVLHS